MEEYLLKANALERKWYYMHRTNAQAALERKWYYMHRTNAQAAPLQRFFLRNPITIFCVLASPEITINFRYLRILSALFSVFIVKYRLSTNMFNKPH